MTAYCHLRVVMRDEECLFVILVGMPDQCRDSEMRVEISA